MQTADTNTSHGKIASSQVTKKRLDGPAGTLAWRGALISVVSRQWRPSTSFCRQRKQRKEKQSQCRWRRHHPSVWWCGCNHRSIHTHTHRKAHVCIWRIELKWKRVGYIYIFGSFVTFQKKQSRHENGKEKRRKEKSMISKKKMAYSAHNERIMIVYSRVTKEFDDEKSSAMPGSLFPIQLLLSSRW